ncbi:MAG: hypothetical protein IT371_25985 [Deltaproteobacteria bacterium]|nr:hypothetical protein [Deltaproteobacteria bacterium]
MRPHARHLVRVVLLAAALGAAALGGTALGEATASARTPPPRPRTLPEWAAIMNHWGSEYQRKQRDQLPVRQLLAQLHSEKGQELLEELVKTARAHTRDGTATPFERAFLVELRQVKRQRDQGGEDRFRLWSRRRLHNPLPAALLNVLQGALHLTDEYTDYHPTGYAWLDHVWVDPVALGRTLGEDAVAFARRLQREASMRRETLGQLRPINQWSVFAGLRAGVARFLADATGLGPRLPVLEYVVRKDGRLPPMRGALVRLPMRTNTLTFFEALGLPAGQTVVYDEKVHFLDPRVAEAAAQLGLRVRGKSVKGDRPFLETWVRNAVAPLEQLSAGELAAMKPQFLVLDDGGELLLQLVHLFEKRPELARYAHLFGGVEQTGSGSNKLRKIEHVPFRVEDLARGADKAKEGPDIYGYVVAAQAYDLHRHYARQGLLRGTRVAVLGAGQTGQGIGFGIAKFLAIKGYQVSVYDKAQTVRELLAANGLFRQLGVTVATDDVSAVKDADIVITCTAGNRALDAKLLERLAVAVPEGRTQLWLAAGSPGEIERFKRTPEERQRLRVDRRGIVRATFGEKQVVLGHANAGPDLDRLIPHGNWNILLARNGQVCNGRTRLVSNMPGLLNVTVMEELGSGDYAQPRPTRTDNPIADYAIDEELARMYRAAHLVLGGGDPGVHPVPPQPDLTAEGLRRRPIIRVHLPHNRGLDAVLGLDGLKVH